MNTSTIHDGKHSWIKSLRPLKRVLHQGLAALAVLFALCVVASADTDAGRELALKIIPTPKLLSLQNGMLPIVTNGKFTLTVFTPENPDKKETLAAKWVTKEIATLAKAQPAIAAGPSGIGQGCNVDETQLVLATYNQKTKTLDKVIGLLDDEDQKLLSDPRRSEQAYVICCDKNQIVVVGGSDQGTLYGTMTLLQLFQGDADNLAMPSVHVRDWPDFKYRLADNWTYTEGRSNQGRGWCYDWGEGMENYKKRAVAIFDRCLRYKINMICYSADFWGESSWDGDDFPAEKELNRLAADRGIKLMHGGLGIGCEATGLLNRKSYPDGEKYKCLTTNILGNCRSNDELTRQIQKMIGDYVRKTEPRALYIHNEDSDTFASAEWLWKNRCEDCRRRWPNDAMAAADGAAGAIAHAYNAISDAIFSVKNADSGYDASRDCLVMHISPTYSNVTESDVEWDKQLKYWKTVSKLLKRKKNVCFSIREQMLRRDNNKKRVLEMSEAIRPQGAEGPGLFLFSVSPASLYRMGPLFLPVPAAMSKLNEGSEVAYYMCGRIFQEPLILLNASHMWNMDSLGSVELPKTASKCNDLYWAYADGSKQTPGIYGKGGFLELACRRLYGTKAGKHMEKLYEMKAQPLAYAYALYIWSKRSGLYWDWRPELKVTSEAIAHVEAALNEPDCNEENRPILERFRKCLKAGAHFAEIRLEFQELVVLAVNASTTSEDVEAKAAIVEKRIEAMEKFLKDNFTYDWATPRGGDIANWNSHLTDMRSLLSRSVEAWTDEIRAHQIADREEANGGVSPLANGDMESDCGWKFLRVTGDEEVGYADGGYVDDKALGGKRSYRIIKLPVTELIHKWPMPKRETWGEIEQEIKVKPGQKYVVAFDVFANWNKTNRSERFEYTALLDGKPMWALDGAVPRGWKKGGFFFVAKSPKVTLKLRTTDINFSVGWGDSQGDSWWDNVKVYPVSK